ncbi:MAG: isoprenyl transferase [Candidatus Cloacimonetes bacterium]|jgi:undecaprenyl diphosphate synthase|nr:isoprenyl transferase [Candidatus Cloacimonadota bacterium]
MFFFRKKSEIEKYKKLINSKKLPNHIAVIMDGNGRWAKKQGAGRLYGHRNGVESVRAIVEASVEIGLKYLTIYAFSTENWSRPEDEVKGLLKLILDSLVNEIDQMSKNNIVVRFIGTNKNLSPEYQEKIHRECEKSWNNTGLNFNIAMNYGGRLEILEAVKKIMPLIKSGEINEENICEKDIEQYLYTAGMPDPDLMIRTSGEMRLSNYLIWQSAYTELYFTDILWPDFKKEAFLKAIVDFQKRNRRFGGI